MKRYLERIVATLRDRMVLWETPDPKRVLMVTEALARGGAERQTLALTEGLLKRGYRVEIVELFGVVPGQYHFIDEFRALGITPRRAVDVPCALDDRGDALAIADRLQPYAAILPEGVKAICAGLTAVMARFRPDLVYCLSDLASLLGGSAAAFSRIPRTVLALRTFPPSFFVEPAIADAFREAYVALLQNPNITMLSNSSASARAYESWLGIDQDIKVVRNGFAQGSITIPGNDATGEFRRSLGIPSDAAVVGTVIRFAPAKDPELWLRTADLVGAARPDVHFILNGYGHDNIAEQLRALGERSGLGRRLHMPAVIGDVGRVYGAIDVFLLTSKTESTPNVLLEAQVAGIPVVSPAVGGVGETMLDGITGALVAERSASALADAVLTLLGDPARRELAKISGPAFIAQKFGLERMIDETIASWD
jgi:glycosyltransferase involved in cell wall biosynthesis